MQHLNSRGFVVDMKLQGDADGWTPRPGGTRWSGLLQGDKLKLQVSKVYSHLSQLLLWQSESGETVGTHINRKTKCGIFLHHSEPLIEGGVLITNIRYHQLSSASISKTTVNYSNCYYLVHDILQLGLLPALQLSLLIQVEARLCPAWGSWYFLHS